jgi:hypothetical protein
MHPSVAPLIALALALAHPALAARTLPADRPVAVKLELSQPTALALPEPIASVSVGLAPERISLDYDGPYLFLLPLDPTITGRLFVVGQSGTLYVVTFKVAVPADDVVHVTAAPAPATRRALPQPLSVATLLRALRTGTPIPGQQAVDLPPPVLPDPRVRVTASSTLAVGPTLGLVLTVRNTQQAPLLLDLRLGLPGDSPSDRALPLSTWTWPPYLTIRAVAAEDEVLAPEGETRIYVVYERRP